MRAPRCSGLAATSCKVSETAAKSNPWAIFGVVEEQIIEQVRHREDNVEVVDGKKIHPASFYPLG